MHSGGLELAKLTYTRLEDNLIRHRGDDILPRLTGLFHAADAVTTSVIFTFSPSDCPSDFPKGSKINCGVVKRLVVLRTEVFVF